MLNYWDLEERERAKLTEQQLDDFIAAECMQKGVLRAKPLELVPDVEMPEPTAPVFTIDLAYRSELVFASAEDASAALALMRGIMDSAYINGQTVPHLGKLRDVAVKAKTVYSEDQVATCRSTIERATAAKQENEKRRADWEQARKAEGEALQGLYSDWHRCCGKARRMAEIVEVFAEYVKTAGDAEIAARFLRKVFSREDIADAAKWCSVHIPIDVEDSTSPEEAAPSLAESSAVDF